MKLNTYLHFNGNCKQAFDFYVKNLGAKLVASLPYDQAPKGGMSDDPNCKVDGDKIMHARLVLPDGSILMGSDCPPARAEKMGSFALNLGYTDVGEAERVYKLMSDKGQIHMPFEETFWAKKFAMFNDQFGVPWMINVEKEMN